MVPNKTDMNFLNRYLDKKEQLYEKKYIPFIKIAICIFLFASIIYVLRNVQTTDSFKGIIAQLQIMISVYLVVGVMKKGYFTAVILNVVQCLFVAKTVFIEGTVSAAPGIVIPIGTIVVITIIYIYASRLNRKIGEITEQKEELVTLYEELAVTEEKLSQQHRQLIEYNKDIMKNEEKLNFLAFFDVLTELPNRKMIINRLDILISLSKKNPIGLAMVFIDLDNFKRINDSMGHDAGDLLLQEVASRLKLLVHPDDMLGRLGGDEFALIIQHQLKEEEILVYVESLKNALSNTFIIENTELSISASFGISIYPQDGSNSIDLLKCSDTAMYNVKDDGRNGVQFFNKEMKDKIVKRLEFEQRLLLSIQNEELYLVFQPQYFSSTKELRGVEALVRWQSPELGLVSPVKFIPVAEETKFIIPMGKWILKTACQKFKKLQETYHINAIISVNISAIQIMEPSFVQMVKDVLAETGISAQYLEIEITESVFISSMEYVIGVLYELRNIGIRVALDDFGTGFSSLSYLQLLPIDTLKIDKIFIDSIAIEKTEKQIVGSIISLVHKMDISVVAEGVENDIQLDYLKNQECDCIQGYLWGKPLNEESLEQLLHQITFGEAEL